ncbi:TOBE domain-containing protein [Pseudohalocynthiibacter aestuariivivens]|jgi:putative spermidine/putrescine transport system ATP-binding protein|uniref:TOBE domain-containing protein n=1 Tax=Pseudohalocynthiibacter aestuariivivens TaxID=1591409 RepID=A0ABV5JEF6_9RHOB|nr:MULTISPECIES: TOBE domain-containing protein [Pseudohalocynthiibacter]MCK0104477.1 TOBE domain-containing protein [Pseudohalocynthiibacter sp. F2068]
MLTLEGGTLQLPKDGTGQIVFVRAEDSLIDPNGPLTGQVETVTFLGTHYRVGIKGVMPGVLTSNFAGQNAPKVGETVQEAIKPEALILLPEGATGA